MSLSDWMNKYKRWAEYMNSLSNTNITALTKQVWVFFQVSGCHVKFTRDSKERMHKITPYHHYYWQLKAFAFQPVQQYLKQHAWHLRVYAICWCFLKRSKLSEHWPFQCLPFMHVYLPQLCLPTVSVDTLSSALLRLSFLTSLWCFFLTRGWRLTYRTGWTTHAPMTKGVSTTMMKMPQWVRVTLRLTDMGLMSTMTTINSNLTHSGWRGLFLHQPPVFILREYSPW